MISFILFLCLMCTPDGARPDGKVKTKGTEKSSQPVKSNVTVVQSTNLTTVNPGSADGTPVQKQTTPGTTNIQMGVSSSNTNVTAVDTIQKSAMEPTSDLKWIP